MKTYRKRACRTRTRKRACRTRTRKIACRGRRRKMGGSEIKTTTVQQPDGPDFIVEYDDNVDVYYNRILTHPSNHSKSKLKNGKHVIIGDGEYRVKIVPSRVRDQLQADTRDGMENIKNSN